MPHCHRLAIPGRLLMILSKGKSGYYGISTRRIGSRRWLYSRGLEPDCNVPNYKSDSCGKRWIYATFVPIEGIHYLCADKVNGVDDFAVAAWDGKHLQTQAIMMWTCGPAIYYGGYRPFNLIHDRSVLGASYKGDPYCKGRPAHRQTAQFQRSVSRAVSLQVPTIVLPSRIRAGSPDPS